MQSSVIVCECVNEDQQIFQDDLLSALIWLLYLRGYVVHIMRKEDDIADVEESS